MSPRFAWIIPALVVAGLASGCVDNSTYDERIEYLNTVSAKGVEMNGLIIAADGEATDNRCRELYAGLEEELPAFTEDGGLTTEYEEEEAFIAQAEQLFVDACMSGKSAQTDLLDVMESATPSASKD